MYIVFHSVFMQDLEDDMEEEIIEHRSLRICAYFIGTEEESLDEDVRY